MNKSILIREYKPSDKQALLAVLMLNVPRYFAESEIDDFDRYLDQEAEMYFVAEYKGKIAGAGGINFEGHRSTGKISWDFLHPEFQRSGIGTQLLSHRISILQSIESISLIMVRTSQLAYRFYEKNGFTLKEIQRDYWAEGFDLYLMHYEQ